MRRKFSCFCQITQNSFLNEIIQLIKQEHTRVALEELLKLPERELAIYRRAGVTLESRKMVNKYESNLAYRSSAI